MQIADQAFGRSPLETASNDNIASLEATIFHRVSTRLNNLRMHGQLRACQSPLATDIPVMRAWNSYAVNRYTAQDYCDIFTWIEKFAMMLLASGKSVRHGEQLLSAFLATGTTPNDPDALFMDMPAENEKTAKIHHITFDSWMPIIR